MSTCKVCHYPLLWSATKRAWVRSDTGNVQCPASSTGLHKL
jgi:hypothetical protein